jgi:transposase-like protein
MKPPTIDSETKMAAVLEGFRGESSITDICRQYQISGSLYYRWRDKFLKGGSPAVPVRVRPQPPVLSLDTLYLDYHPIPP